MQQCLVCLSITKHRHTQCLKKSQNYFCHNFVKFTPILINFSINMANTTELCKVNSLTTSTNLCQRTNVWNTDAPDCYIMQQECARDLLIRDRDETLQLPRRWPRPWSSRVSGASTSRRDVFRDVWGNTLTMKKIIRIN